MTLSSNGKIVLKTSLLSAVFTVLLLLLTNYFFNHSWNFFLNSQMKTQTLNVQGTGTASAKPDQSTINFTVSKTAEKLQDAQNQANTFTNKIVADLQKFGIAQKDIQTSNYSSYPNYDQPGTGQPELMMRPVQSSQSIVSYTVNENVTITLSNVDKANAVIDTITKDGAENISGPDLAFSDAKQKQLETDARTNAINDAKQKAESMAITAGLHLGKITGIQEGNANPYPIQPMLKMQANSAAGSAPTQINPGQNTVTTTVTLSYETY